MGNLESNNAKVTLDLILNIKEDTNKLTTFYVVSLLVITVLNLITLYLFKHH
jgi:hypothetical protein